MTHQETDWQDRAACKGAPAGLFTPDRPTLPIITAAQSYCDGATAPCPVRAECAAYAKAMPGEPYGMWAGQWHQLPDSAFRQLVMAGWTDTRIGRLVGRRRDYARHRRVRLNLPTVGEVVKQQAA